MTGHEQEQEPAADVSIMISEMTDSVTSERPGKRDRLVAGACETIYRQGVEATTIADIAEAADVPAGNVYYYFKSKDELVAAAIDAYAKENRQRLSSIEQKHRTPRARLKVLVDCLCRRPIRWRGTGAREAACAQNSRSKTATSLKPVQS